MKVRRLISNGVLMGVRGIGKDRKGAQPDIHYVILHAIYNVGSIIIIWQYII